MFTKRNGRVVKSKNFSVMYICLPSFVMYVKCVRMAATVYINAISRVCTFGSNCSDKCSVCTYGSNCLDECNILFTVCMPDKYASLSVHTVCMPSRKKGGGFYLARKARWDQASEVLGRG